MSYVDGLFDRNADVIRVVERNNGVRQFIDYPAKYTFYYKDPAGKFRSVYGDPVSRIVCKNSKDFKRERAMNSGSTTFEADINPLNQCLSENYLGKDSPKLNVAFWDIETDFEPYQYPLTRQVEIRKRSEPNVKQQLSIRELLHLQNAFRYEVYDHVDRKWCEIKNSRYMELGRGFAPTDDAFLPITAITVYLQWMEALVTLAMPPDTMSWAEAEKSVSKWEGSVMLFPKSDAGEKQMLDTFFQLIEDADVLSGWNCSGYDIPYTVNRVQKLMGKAETRRFCLWNQLPKKREYEKFGKKQITYDLKGRINLDYLELYRKNTFEERHTYRLDAIGEIEVGENKTPYEGTLDQLYNEDFVKFIEYNRQDVALLDKIDQKLKFLELINELAHDTTVTMPVAMGSVGVIDQAIINEAKYIRDLVVQNKKDSHKDNKVAGAYVAYPKKGFHQWVGSMDLNSLYPSIIRALNMSPETIVGQIRLDLNNAMIIEDMNLHGKTHSACWEGKFATLEYDAVMRRDKATMLTVDWEDGRTDVLSGAQIYKMVFEQRNPIMMSANGTLFTTEFEGIIPGILKRWYSRRLDEKAKKKEAEKNGDFDLASFWDRKQHLTKILLNSLFGALLNVGSRFFDERLGQSITLTGRSIVQHMSAEVNKIITGDYDYKGVAVVYGDSVAEDTLIHINDGRNITVEELFESLNDRYVDPLSQKQYSRYTNELNIQGKKLKVQGYASDLDESIFGEIEYVMRHQTTKEKWTIHTEDESVTVTGDHSIIVDRKGELMELKPSDIKQTDLLIVRKPGSDDVDHKQISCIELEGIFENEWVYDISIRDQEPYFFGNGILVHNTDSCTKDSFVRTDTGAISIEELFLKGHTFWNDGDKEYSRNDDIQVTHYDDGDVRLVPYNYVYRHKTDKPMYKICTFNGKTVKVTEDHSVMVVTENDTLTEKKPMEITSRDTVITLVDGKEVFNKVYSVTQVETGEDYVYDLGVRSRDPYFFASDILIHNSVYFSAFPVLEKDIKDGKIPWDNDSVIRLYDQICEQANSTFGDFMLEAFHCPASRSDVIQAGREIVATSGLFITKKRYAALVIDDEGQRKDVDGSSGKLKAMGLDLRRSDTPEFMQEFLKEILMMVLEEHTREAIMARITEFRQEFKSMPDWEKGTPKKVNNLTTYKERMEKNPKTTVPGHVRASLNWNTLKKMNGDSFSQNIVDGMKVIVCKLKANPMGFTSVAYPVDQLVLPEWFKELNFNDDTMEETIVDKKLNNLIGVLEYNLDDTRNDNTFGSLFDWG